MLEYKQKIISLYSIIEQLKLDYAIHEVEELLNRISNDSFHLVVVGEFSRGKSTFVNALLGCRILPASKNPTTAIISKIVYGKKSGYQIYYHGSDIPQNLTKDDFKKLTAPAEPDQNDLTSMQEYIKAQEELARIDYAQITYPLSFCQNGVEVIDTPGTNDLNAMRLDVTYNYLANADAVVLLLSATQPLSASEAKFIQERILGNQIHDIFFVISRKDELENKDQEERVLDFVRKNLKKILPEEVNLDNRIFLLASRSALFFKMHENGEKLTIKQEMEIPNEFTNTGFPNFVNSLSEFLANDKGMVRFRKYQREALAIIRKVQHDVSINLVIAAHSTDEIRQRAELLTDELKKARAQVEQVITELRLELMNEGTSFNYRCQKAGQNILTTAKNTVDSLEENMSVMAMQQAIEQAVIVEKKHFMDTLIRECYQIIDKEADKARAKLTLIWQDIDIAYHSTFNFPMEVKDCNEFVLYEKNGSLSQDAFQEAGALLKEMLRTDRNLIDRIANGVAATFATAVGVISGIFSMLTGQNQTDWRSKVKCQVIEAYSAEGQRLQETFHQQYMAMVTDLCQQIKVSVDERINDMNEQLMSILHEKESRENDSKRLQEELKQQKEKLHQIYQELEKNIV